MCFGCCEVMSVTNHTMLLWRDAAFCNNGALLGCEWMCSDYDSAGYVYKIKWRLLTQRFAISAAEKKSQLTLICTNIFKIYPHMNEYIIVCMHKRKEESKTTNSDLFALIVIMIGFLHELLVSQIKHNCIFPTAIICN